MASATTTSALRSLNSTFVRKGIVASSTGSESRDLPDQVLVLVQGLKSACESVCENARDVGSFLQLWKERSLHQTLQALDSNAGTSIASGNSDGGSAASSHEKQIQAIEMHEKAGREMNEMLQRHRAETARDVNSQIDFFTEQLAGTLAELIKPELEEELERERAIVGRLVQEKQRLDQAQLSLVQTNQELCARIESLENAPSGGGDAILCNKLRERVRELCESRLELLASVEAMAKEREKHRWDMLQMKQELELQQRTFLMTKAMHEKETRQLVELVRNRQAQFASVMHVASSSGAAGGSNTFVLPRNRQPQHQTQQRATLEVYDPVSGRTIQHASKSPQKQQRGHTPRSSATTKSGGVAFIASPPTSPKRKLQVSPSNTQPNQQRRSLDLDQAQQEQQREHDSSLSTFALAEPSRTSQQGGGSPLQSPGGHVRRFVAFSDPNTQRSTSPQALS